MSFVAPLPGPGTKKRVPTQRIVVALVVAAVISILWSILVPPLQGASAAESFGAAFGAALFRVSIVWAVAFWTLVRGNAGGWGLRGWIVLFIPIVILEMGAMAYQRTQVRTVAEGLSATYRSAVAGHARVSPLAQGSAGVLQALVQNLIVQVAQDNRDYKAELAATNVLGILKPEHLASDPDFAADQRSIQQGHAIVAKYQQRLKDRETDVRAKILASNLSQAEKNAATTGLEKGLADNAANADRIWVLENGVLDQLSAICAMLDHERGQWAMHGKAVRFSRPADLIAFNGHLATIRALSEEEQRIRTGALAKSDRELERMRQ